MSIGTNSFRPFGVRHSTFGLRSAAAFVSLDHFSAAVHDRTRGVSGAFQSALAAIDACLAAGLYTAAQAVVEPDLLRPPAGGPAQAVRTTELPVRGERAEQVTGGGACATDEGHAAVAPGPAAREQ